MKLPLWTYSGFFLLEQSVWICIPHRCNSTQFYAHNFVYYVEWRFCVETERRQDDFKAETNGWLIHMQANEYHVPCGSVSTVNGDRLSQWEMANFGPLQNPNPLTDCQKIATVDYVREPTRYANFGANPSTGGFWANGWNITFDYFYIHIPFLFGEQPFDLFWRVMTQKTRNHARMCLFGVTKIKSDI